MFDWQAVEIAVPWINSGLGLTAIWANARYSLWGPTLYLLTIPLWAAFMVAGNHWGMAPAEIVATILLVGQFRKWKNDGRTFKYSKAS